MSNLNAIHAFTAGEAPGEARERVDAPIDVLVGRFAADRIRNAGVMLLAEKIAHGLPLTLQDAQSLSSLRLPLLGKLVELAKKTSVKANPQIPIVRPVVYLPLASMLEKQRHTEGIAQAGELIAHRSEHLDRSFPLFLAVDRWSGVSSAKTLLELIAELIATSALGQRLSIIGPSTAELLALSAKSEPSQPTALQDLLQTFRDGGVVCVEGGSDLRVHRLATELGLNVAVGQPVREVKTFAQELWELNQQLGASGLLAVWFPWSATALDGPITGAAGSSNEPLGLQLLQAIALARLLLPSVPRIRASVSLLGINMASLALTFGANDLGYAAVDSDTARALGIARLSDCLEILNPQQQEPVRA